MMLQVKYFITTFILLVIQTQALKLLSLEGITPDILLIWLVYIALKKGQMTATVWGFIIGLLFDLFTGSFIGLCALSKSIAGFTAGFFYNENKVFSTLGNYMLVVIVMIVSLAHNIVYFIAFTQGSDIGLWRAVFQFGVATAFYTSAISFLPMFFFSRKNTH